MRNIYIALCLLVLAGTGCTSKQIAQKVYGRYVPERKDDFAWENEYAAYRLYGPALAPENPSNGVDLWLKASPEMIVDSFYYRETQLHLPYHINYGKGLDCYKVGHTAGCGGVVAMTCDVNQETGEQEPKLWGGGPYSRWEVLEQTPEKLVFRLFYDSLLVRDKVLQEQLTITAEAGKLLNKAEVVISDKTQADEAANAEEAAFPLWLGGGIYLHDTVENYLIDDVTGLIAYAEDALSDKQAAKMNYEHDGSTSQGRTYVAVRTPGATVQKIIDGTLVSLAQYRLGDTFTYYFGGCWSEWTDGVKAFKNDIDWFNALEKE
ncbi:MAG: DUF4861 family protein [Paludibacteraceae bacterium]|nr:DUF4861 family protein [Paludibacteraceae bacterium]